MTKAAENYFQLKQIKNQDYVVDFKTGKANNGLYFENESKTSAEKAEADKPTSATAYKIMLAALSLKGDIPKEAEIDLFRIDQNGAVALAFSNTNAYCMTVDGNVDFNKANYEAVKAAINAETPTTFNTATGMYGDTMLKIGGTAVCVSK